MQACDEILAGKLHEQFVVDMIQGGAGTSTNMCANEVIANRALEILGHRKGEYQFCHPNDHVNCSQSTNDAYPTAIKLGVWFTLRDTLTGLFNRAYLDKFLTEAFDQSEFARTPLSVAFADLDKFKWINDTHGHGAGDQVLMATANILRANVRGTDVIARYGGEEFVLVFPNTDYILVKTICERIVKAFQTARHDIAGGTESLAVTISMGMATHNDGRRFDSPAALVAAADKALYSAKLQGRNRSIPFELVVSETAEAS